jgi:hypothetical protein
MSQMSLFAAGVTDPSLDDLEGLLVGPGSIERRADAARLRIVVADQWRAEAAARSLAALTPDPETCEVEVSEGMAFEVRTPFLPGLYAMAQRWHSPTGKQAPADLRIDGARLWWWCLVAGEGDGAGYRLGLGRGDGDACWTAAGAALAGAGVAAALVGQQPHSAEGPAYRVVGTRRLVRLAELVGAVPYGVPATAWPVPGTRPVAVRALTSASGN